MALKDWMLEANIEAGQQEALRTKSIKDTNEFHHRSIDGKIIGGWYGREKEGEREHAKQVGIDLARYMGV